MINREDMLELTRRMTPKRTSFTRIAGCYFDAEGEIDGTFNTNFLNLSGADKEKNLLIAKTIPFSRTNEQLKSYRVPLEKQKPGSIWQLLLALRACGLKNDALMDSFYEHVSQKVKFEGDYAVFLFHDRYDVPVKAADKERLGESEEVYEYLIGALCPLQGDYEPGEPVAGFIFPSFCDRSCDLEHVLIYQADPAHPYSIL